MKEIGLYIHIPFCKSKCYYCDFVSYTDKQKLEQRYVEAIKKEIVKNALENEIMSKHDLEEKYIIDTIYIGGGTPSSIDEKYIVSIINTVKSNFTVLENAEITIEVNPGTASKEKLHAYYNCEINRLSIGLQATQDTLLKEIGRIHNYKQFIETFKYARECGFKNINADLMIGLPSQTLVDIKNSVKDIIKLNPEHISVYSLILEEGTVLYNMVNNKQLELVSDDLEREMYWYVKETLEKNGYNQYEISNFSKIGLESKHNTNCWNQKEYLGIGAAASSFIENVRYSNIDNLEEYIENIEKEEQNKNLILEEKLDEESRMKEYMMLGLRKITGVNITEFELKFNQNPIIKYCKELEKLNKDGLIIVVDNNIKLTNEGIDLANLVWEKFI